MNKPFDERRLHHERHQMLPCQHPRGGTAHGKTGGGAIVVVAGSHHQISGQFVSMFKANTAQLVRLWL